MSFSYMIEPHQEDLTKCLDIAFDHLGEFFHTLDWKGHMLDFSPPIPPVQRLYTEIFGISFCLMKQYGDLGLHPHPWDMHVKRLLGSYETKIGFSDTVTPPTDFETVLIKPGDSYSMLRNYWHSVKTFDEMGDNLSIVVMGKLHDPLQPYITFMEPRMIWDDKIPIVKFHGKGIFPMTEIDKEKIKEEFRKACHVYGKPVCF